ncbi:hypothetical protein OIU85_021164 [Salix viminalis]|uniref:Uncharacterized protein n=1 Tax=Salix viminalis TaxID=40686 RepID=A0A9Q0UHZ7_SALVM|nr:hypothetical protein OIU85_021164 [Salix viminalis]
MRGWRCRKRWILRPRGKPSSWWSFPASSRRRMRSGCCERNCLDLVRNRNHKKGSGEMGREERKKGVRARVLLGSDSSEKLHGDPKISDLPDSNQRPKDGN